MDSNLGSPMANTPQADGERADDGGGGGGGGLSRLAMSMIEGGGGAAVTSSAPVPDVLLSLAKDDRYVSEVTSLLSQIAVPFASVFLLRGGRSQSDAGNRDGASSRPSSGSTSSRRGSEIYNGEEILEDEGQRFIERIRPELNLLASVIVHSATFIFYTRNVGNQVAEANKGERIQRSLGMESLNLAYRYPSCKGSGSASYLTLHNNKGKRSFFRDYLTMIFPSWESSRWHWLLFLQTMAPYIINRVGRGGWSKDLGGLVSIFREQCGLGPREPGIPRSGASTVGSEALRNDDRLRGSARRRLFDEQRRRMLDASGGISQPNVNAILGRDPEGRHTLGESNANGRRHESAFFGANNTQTSTPRSSVNISLERRLGKLSTLSWNAMHRIFLAVASLRHGAHSLPRNANIMNMGTGERLDRYAKIIKWFLRLHLALFYWNGMYPTITHRLAGAKIRDDVAPNLAGVSRSPMTGVIVANRPTYKPIAALILIQALAAFAQTTAEASIELAHFVQVSFFRWRQRRRMQQQRQHRQNNGRLALDEVSSPVNRTNSERAEYMGLIEERVPGIASSKRIVLSKQKSRSKKHLQLGAATQPCGICLNERVDPAAPSVCGHVFCWNCILHWVSNVRAECPLCRAETRHKEIIPLYNYP